MVDFTGSHWRSGVHKIPFVIGVVISLTEDYNINK